MMRTRLEAHRHLVAIPGQEPILAVLSSIGEEALPLHRRVGSQVGGRDVLDPSTEKLRRLVTKRGLDASADRHVAMVIVRHQHE